MTLGSAGVSGKKYSLDVDGGASPGFVTVTKSVAGEATTAFVNCAVIRVPLAFTEVLDGCSV